MDRVFLDANILYSAACRPNAGLRRLWNLPDLQLLTSAYAIEEARRNLHGSEQRKDLEQLLQAVRVIVIAPPDRPIVGFGQLPEKDRPILLAAIASQATHLLTGDFSHFGSFYGQTIEGVLILSPAQYLRLHRSA